MYLAFSQTIEFEEILQGTFKLQFYFYGSEILASVQNSVVLKSMARILEGGLNIFLN